MNAQFNPLTFCYNFFFEFFFFFYLNILTYPGWCKTPVNWYRMSISSGVIWLIRCADNSSSSLVIGSSLEPPVAFKYTRLINSILFNNELKAIKYAKLTFRPSVTWNVWKIHFIRNWKLEKDVRSIQYFGLLLTATKLSLTSCVSKCFLTLIIISRKSNGDM